MLRNFNIWLKISAGCLGKNLDGMVTTYNGLLTMSLSCKLYYANDVLMAFNVFNFFHQLIPSKLKLGMQFSPTFSAIEALHFVFQIWVSLKPNGVLISIYQAFTTGNEVNIKHDLATWLLLFTWWQEYEKGDIEILQ